MPLIVSLWHYRTNAINVQYHNELYKVFSFLRGECENNYLSDYLCHRRLTCHSSNTRLWTDHIKIHFDSNLRLMTWLTLLKHSCEMALCYNGTNMVGVEKNAVDFPRKQINSLAAMRWAIYQDICKNRENLRVFSQKPNRCHTLSSECKHLAELSLDGLKAWTHGDQILPWVPHQSSFTTIDCTGDSKSWLNSATVAVASSDQKVDSVVKVNQKVPQATPERMVSLNKRRPAADKQMYFTDGVSFQFTGNQLQYLVYGLNHCCSVVYNI